MIILTAKLKCLPKNKLFTKIKKNFENPQNIYGIPFPPISIKLMWPKFEID